MAAEPKAISKMTFKEMMTELEGIVQVLERGDLELEESLKLYERGVKLLSTSREKLDKAQQKVDNLLDKLDVENDESFDGTPS